MNRDLIEANDPIAAIGSNSHARWQTLVLFLDGLVTGIVAGATIGLIFGYVLRGQFGG